MKLAGKINRAHEVQSEETRQSTQALAKQMQAGFTSLFLNLNKLWVHGGVVVSALDFRSEGRWFAAQSLPLCCFLGQEN